MAVITMGVMIASYGELLFVLAGVVYQLASICTESNRIVLVQILLQSKGVKLNPITTMYYISPCCLVFLFLPWLIIEAPLLFSPNNTRVWLDQASGGTPPGTAWQLSRSVLAGCPSFSTKGRHRTCPLSSDRNLT